MVKSQTERICFSVSTATRTRLYTQRPVGLNASSRSMGGRSKPGLAKVISSPWTRSQSPFGRVMAFLGRSMMFCVRVSASGSAVPVASMLLSGISKAGNPAGR